MFEIPLRMLSFLQTFFQVRSKGGGGGFTSFRQIVVIIRPMPCPNSHNLFYLQGPCQCPNITTVPGEVSMSENSTDEDHQHPCPVGFDREDPEERCRGRSISFVVVFFLFIFFFFF